MGSKCRRLWGSTNTVTVFHYRVNRCININEPDPTTDTFVTVHEALHDLPILENGIQFFVYLIKYSEVSLRKRGKSLTLRIRQIIWSQEMLRTFLSDHYVPQGGNWEKIPSR